MCLLANIEYEIEACNKKIRTYLEEPQQLARTRVDIQTLAQLLHLFKDKLLVLLLVSPLPVLLLPYRLAHFYVAETAHQFLTNGVEFPERCVPHAKDILGGGNEMQRLVRAVDDVDDGEPAILVLLGELELLSIVTGIRAGPQFLDVL